jgi:L-lactate dehydrogenase complex protein LldG
VPTSLRTRAEIVAQFAEYAEEYRAHVVRVGFTDLDDAIQALLAAHEHSRVVVPEDFPEIWLTGNLVVERDRGLDHRALAEMQAVVTGCAVAVAETGTIVLDAGFAQGRRAITLIPDHHVCVVFEDQVVDTVPEAVELVGASVRKGQPLTWISGPSATSDIELNRVEGVHGPRILDVVLVSR